MCQEVGSERSHSFLNIGHNFRLCLVCSRKCPSGPRSHRESTSAFLVPRSLSVLERRDTAARKKSRRTRSVSALICAVCASIYGCVIIVILVSPLPTSAAESRL